MLNQFKFSKTAVAVSVFCSSLLTGCGGDNKSAPVVIVDPIDTTPVTLLSPVKGKWNKLGYGQLLQIEDESVEIYEFNQFGCLQTGVFNLEQAQSLIAAIDKVGENTLNLKLKGFVDGDYYQAQESLPESCQTPIILRENNSPIETFEYFWHTFNDYYAFFAQRNVDWQQAYEQYRPLISDETSDEQLIDIISAMLEPLEDAHVSLTAGEYGFQVAKPVPMQKAMIGALLENIRHGDMTDLSEVEMAFAHIYLGIQTGYLTPQSIGTFPQGEIFPTLVWGKTEHNVGVLVINDMMNYLDEPASEVNFNDLIDAVHSKMVVIMQSLADTDGMIIDIRNNEGGTDDVSLAIASYFANETTHVFDKQAQNIAGTGHQYSATLEANDNAYTNPVYVLTSQRTTSAGEIFAMAMDAIDHATLVGEPTSGALSDVLDMTLPNGWSVSLSNEVYKNSAGEVFEVSGVLPDVELPAYTYESISSGGFETYEYAFEQLDKAQPTQISEQQLEGALTQLMAEGTIVGASVAVVKGDEIVYQRGFGRADEQGTPVTEHTPFYLASVSKALLGTTIAQAEAAGLVDINEPVTQSIGFNLLYPDAQDFTPTLRHLMTHTSGIIDHDDVYPCTMYVLEDNSSLANKVDDSQPCEDNINPDLGNFLTRYLSADGELYHHDNFTAKYSLEAGEVSFYSNIATSLAGYALEGKTGKSLPQLTAEYVTGPIGMSNTSWSITGAPENTAKRYIVYGEQAYPIAEYNGITYPDGGAISTAHDLAKYMIAVKNGGVYQGEQVLNQGAVAKTLTSQSDAAVVERGVGYFWRLDGDYFAHDGDDPGVITKVWADKRKDVAVVLLTNGDMFDDQAQSSFSQMLNLLKAYGYGL